MTTTTTPARPALDSATQMIILHVARAAGPAGCIALAGDGTGKAVSADISVGSAVCRFAPPPTTWDCVPTSHPQERLYGNGPPRHAEVPMNSSTTLTRTCASWHTSSTTPRVQTHAKNDVIRLNGFIKEAVHRLTWCRVV